MADRERGDARLLQHLAALERMIAEDGGRARGRLEAELGSEKARLLVEALSSKQDPESDEVRRVASA